MDIDLNADLGEGYGPWRMGDDEALLGVVSSANVACGFHAGDPVIMERTIRIAAARGVDIGAHVGFPDRQGFGRRVMQIDAGRLAVGKDRADADRVAQRLLGLPCETPQSRHQTIEPGRDQGGARTGAALELAEHRGLQLVIAGKMLDGLGPQRGRYDDLLERRGFGRRSGSTPAQRRADGRETAHAKYFASI